ncbi:MAG TPA: TolC family protein [Phycisphaerales bacterium]|nr:TolC family protein [Phycisphaerales bacterium]
MRRSVTTDPTIHAALARVRIALANADQARLWPNPVFNLALRWPESGGSPTIEASLAQDLLTILQTKRRANAADNRLRQAAADAMAVALDVASEVQERYATAQAFDELIPALETRRELLNRLIDLAHSRLNAGEGTRQDLTVLQAQRVELDVEIATTELERRDVRLRLARLIGEPSAAATWELDHWVAPSYPNVPESVWVDLALQHRPEIQSVIWQLAALGDDLALTRLLPIEGFSTGGNAEKNFDRSIGPEISTPLPLFDMGQARRARVTAEQIEARHELTRTKRMVVEDVRQAYETLERTSFNMQRVRSELIPLQEQRMTDAEAMFRAERDITGLILAEQDLRGAQARAIDLERQMTIAMIRLHRAVGGAGVAKTVAVKSVSIPIVAESASHLNPAPLPTARDESKEMN